MTASAEPSGGPSGGDNEPKPPQPTAGEDFEDEEDENEEEPEQPAADGKAKGKKKKRSKRKAIKDALTGGAKTPADASGESSATRGDQASARGIQELLKNNPSLEKEFAGMSPDKVEEMLKKMNSMGGKKNKKDMASYKFWQTQPVPRFDAPRAVEEGPIKEMTLDKVPKEPATLIEGFEWVTMDLTNEGELVEVYELLTGHYVEDDEAMFRFNYSESFLNWALKSPGWKAAWHVGVRATKSRKLVAFISAIPVELRVREATLKCSEVNFLCIHKKLRNKRLTPVLIQEITRRINLEGIWQAIYTGGVVLPTPVSTCRYFHRSIEWLKLHQVGFSPLPPGSTTARQVTKYSLPGTTSTPGLRPMERKDIDAVLDLLRRYLARFDMAPVFTREEVEHWLLHEDATTTEQVVWTYVVQESGSEKITDVFSFYCLESSVIRHDTHKTVRAAYLFYYATESAFEGDRGDHRVLGARLNVLMEDALNLAKKFHFDVFNALTLLDNALFLEKQKFGAGDGQLNFYLYNYATAPILGGVTAKNQIDDKNCSGVGVVML